MPNTSQRIVDSFRRQAAPELTSLPPSCVSFLCDVGSIQWQLLGLDFDSVETDRMLDMNICKSAFLAIILAVTGCASMNDAMTPSLSVTKDRFDDTTIVKQPIVPANSSFSDSLAGLGFEWKSSLPDKIILTVGISGIENIEGADFKADGQDIPSPTTAGYLTQYPEKNLSFGDMTSTYSTRRMVMPLGDFVKIANAKQVKMKIHHIDTYSVSIFGRSEMAVVGSKFEPFLAKLKDMKVIQ